MLNLVFFLENHLLHWRNGISKFFYRKTDFYTLKYYFWCTLLFSKRKTNLVFDFKSCIFRRKPSFTLEKRISKFFLQKNCFLLCKILFCCRLLFSTRKTNLVFDVKSCIFPQETIFYTGKTGFLNFFYRKTDFHTVKYYFSCRLLYSTRKTNLVFDVKSCIFLRKPSFTLEKRDF